MPNKIARRTSVPRITVKFVIACVLSVLFYTLDATGTKLYAISPDFSLMFYLAFVMTAVGSFYFVTLLTRLKIGLSRGSRSEVSMLSSLYKGVAFIACAMGIALVFGQLEGFSAFFATFGGMLLGWSLQAPVSGIAAWILVTVTRPYKIGDRISLPNYGLMGDIIKFSPMYLTLNQVGGTVGSEEPTNRILHVPNATLFGAMIINTTYHQVSAEQTAYILDEVLFRVTFDSDWDTVERILLEAAEQATGDIMAATGTQPYVRSETWDYGTLFRLRYMTDATDRPKMMHEIVKYATKQFQENKNVDFTIPYIYSFKRGLSEKNTNISEDNKQIDLDRIVIEESAPPLEQVYAENAIEIDGITRSIAEKGLQQPLVVRRSLERDDEYILVFGEKRLIACRNLGWKRVPCIVRNSIGADITLPD